MVEKMDDEEAALVASLLDRIILTCAPSLRSSQRLANAESLVQKAQLARRVVDNLLEELRQLRGDSGMSPATLYAATDTILEDVEGHAQACLELSKDLTEADRQALSERLVKFLSAWRVFTGMASERAAFQSATGVLKEIRRKAIYTAVALDRLSQHPDARLTSNAVGHDLGVILQALCDIGGQEDINACHRYVAEHGETKPA